MIRSILALAEILIFFILSIPIMIFLCILRIFNSKLSEKISNIIVKFIFKLLIVTLTIKVHISGLSNIPENTSVLFTANHLSIFDVVTTYPYIKGPCGYLAKKELLKVPFLNVWMYLIECMFLDRKNIKAGLLTINKAINKIKSGISIFVFPEGTRSKDGNLGEFKAGSFKIATRTKAPIIPISIKGTNKVLSKNPFLVKATDVYINIGKPIYTKDLSRDELKHIDKKVREAILSLSSFTSAS